jgi:hypothetical protein
MFAVKYLGPPEFSRRVCENVRQGLLGWLHTILRFLPVTLSVLLALYEILQITPYVKVKNAKSGACVWKVPKISCSPISPNYKTLIAVGPDISVVTWSAPLC